MWYSVLRKRERGVFIGTLCIRHTGRQTLLEQRGWEEVPVKEIGVRHLPDELRSVPTKEDGRSGTGYGEDG
jgi:hypothetical protein